MPEKMPLAKGAHGALPNGPNRTTHTAPWGARGTSKRGRGQDGGPPSVCWVCTEQGGVPDRSSVDGHSAALGPRTAPPRGQGPRGPQEARSSTPQTRAARRQPDPHPLVAPPARATSRPPVQGHARHVRDSPSLRSPWGDTQRERRAWPPCPVPRRGPRTHDSGPVRQDGAARRGVPAPRPGEREGARGPAFTCVQALSRGPLLHLAVAAGAPRPFSWLQKSLQPRKDYRQKGFGP